MIDPEDDSGGDADCGHECVCAAFIAGVYAAGSCAMCLEMSGVDHQLIRLAPLGR